jgi:hypothetical protein
MVIFSKNVKKFLSLKNSNEAYHALHYADGHVYASSPQMLIWLDGEFGKRGSYDFVTGEKADVRMPEFEKIIPPVDARAVYVALGSDELAKLHVVLKGIAAIAAKVPELMSVRLHWDPMGLQVETEGHNHVSVTYAAAGRVHGYTPDMDIRARAHTKHLADLIGYFYQRGGDLQIYAPLRVANQSPLYFAADGTAGVLGQVRDAELYRG